MDQKCMNILPSRWICGMLLRYPKLYAMVCVWYATCVFQVLYVNCGIIVVISFVMLFRINRMGILRVHWHWQWACVCVFCFYCFTHCWCVCGVRRRVWSDYGNGFVRRLHKIPLLTNYTCQTICSLNACGNNWTADFIYLVLFFLINMMKLHQTQINQIDIILNNCVSFILFYFSFVSSLPSFFHKFISNDFQFALNGIFLYCLLLLWMAIRRIAGAAEQWNMRCKQTTLQTNRN